jgi:hypothetical protein
MRARTITCEAVGADGALCGETAVVHMIHYVYGVSSDSNARGFNHVHRETHYDIECPACGLRTQVVCHD